MMNFDYKYIRDCGVKGLIPVLHHLSDEMILTALSIDWWSVDMEERVLLRDEFSRRYPLVEVKILPVGQRWEDVVQEQRSKEKERAPSNWWHLW